MDTSFVPLVSVPLYMMQQLYKYDKRRSKETEETPERREKEERKKRERREKEERKKKERRGHLLLEIPPLLLVHQNQVDIVTNREFLVDVPHGGREVVPTQEQTNGN